MKLQTENYADYLSKTPKEGKHILAQQTGDELVVYQAFNPRIANFAVENQYFGGTHYSYNRMSWIKPNFLWMMYRCGWAMKENQKRVLAISLRTSDFDTILAEAAHSSFKKDIYGTREAWKTALEEKEVRLQWDPDHDPRGEKQARRAIQLGMKGDMLERFGKEMVTHIEDITDFVKAQKTILDKDINQLEVASEAIYVPKDTTICKQIGLNF